MNLPERSSDDREEWPRSWSPRRFLSEAIIWNARRKRLSQPFTIITIDGAGVSFGYAGEVRFE